MVCGEKAHVVVSNEWHCIALCSTALYGCKLGGDNWYCITPCSPPCISRLPLAQGLSLCLRGAWKPRSGRADSGTLCLTGLRSQATELRYLRLREWATGHTSSYDGSVSKGWLCKRRSTMLPHTPSAALYVLLYPATLV